ncbi:hypothetical protein [Oceanotoga teriensis]|uniref:hypothetical protein n=1 Tax=Oceanotoga teriensis TaxID=515440 RepID=UPI0027133985|nr:hypothetical protein [Oceanotoga teriensis]MDO7976608.1 hypothetical protein [Oceanotoga teriensis]
MSNRSFFIIILLLLNIIIFSDVAPLENFNPKQSEDSSDLISITFYNTELTEALNELALQTGKTILMDEYVAGMITADFLDTPFEEVLKKILLPGGFSFKKMDEKTYFVGIADPRSKTFTYLAEKEVMKLNYIDTQTFLQLLPVSYQTYAKVNQLNNSILFYAPKDILDYIKEVQDMVDIKIPDIKLNIYALEVEKRNYNILKSNLFKLTNLANSEFKFEDSKIKLTIPDLLQTEIQMYESNHMADLITNQSLNVKSGKTVNIEIKDKKNLIISSSDNKKTVNTLDSGLGITLTPTYFNKRIQIEFKSNFSKISGIDQTSFNTSNSILETKVDLNPDEVLLIADLDLNQFYNTQAGVEILHTLPIIRLFFSDDEKMDLNKRLMIFLSASIDYSGDDLN